jgi:hypothetical protein
MAREKNPVRSAAPVRAPRKTLGLKQRETAAAPFVAPGGRAALIAEAAYFRAEKRGFAPGHEVEDWLAAEADVDAKLLRAEFPAHV